MDVRSISPEDRLEISGLASLCFTKHLTQPFLIVYRKAVTRTEAWSGNGIEERHREEDKVVTTKT